MGLDVHRDVIIACLIKGKFNQKPEIEIRNFITFRPDMENLKKFINFIIVNLTHKRKSNQCS